MVPRSLRTACRVRRPTLPLQPRHGYAAGFRDGLPADDIDQPGSSPRRGADARCRPAQICQIRAGGLLLRGVRTLVSLVHLPVSLAGPGPSDSAGPSRRCRGCLPPIPVRPDGVGRPELPRPAATSRRRRPFITARSTAPRGALHPTTTTRSAVRRATRACCKAGWVSWSRRSRTPPW